MTITTQEYWDIDGTPLNTLAFNITTIGGSRMGSPGLRSGNVAVPYRPGEMWVPKMPGSRTITLGMWVKGANEDGFVPDDFRLQFNDNWQMLKRLIWRTDRQVTLTKRVRTSKGLVTSRALAEYAGGLEPEMHAPGSAAFTVDLLLADPFFYGDPITWTVPPPPPPAPEGTSQTQIVEPSSPSAHTGYNNPSDDVVRFMKLEFSGGSNYRLYNEETRVALSLDGVSGEATVDTKNFRATSSGQPVMDKVRVSGPNGVPYWFLLARDNNTLRLEGGGAVKITFDPVYT